MNQPVEIDTGNQVRDLNIIFV